GRAVPVLPVPVCPPASERPGNRQDARIHLARGRLRRLAGQARYGLCGGVGLEVGPISAPPARDVEGLGDRAPLSLALAHLLRTVRESDHQGRETAIEPARPVAD